GATGTAWFVAHAKELVASKAASPEERVWASKVLRLARADEALEIWLKILESNPPEELSAEVAREFGRAADEAAVDRVLQSWERIPISSRRGLMLELG